jgi:DNA-directed RNA polymerase subunit beta
LVPVISLKGKIFFRVFPFTMSQTTARTYWGTTNLPLPELDLLSVQKESYDWFLTDGIHQALKEISPITDPSHRTWELRFGRHVIEKPHVSPSTAMEKGLNFDAPLKAEATLRNLKTNDVMTEEVFLGDIPVMTGIGTFIIGGVQRCVVNQLVRSPGVFFTSDVDPSTGAASHSGFLARIRRESERRHHGES